MILCVCEGVPVPKVLAVIDEGARSLEEIEEKCGAGRDCGSCHQRLRELLGESAGPPAATGGHGRGRICAPEP